MAVETVRTNTSPEDAVSQAQMAEDTVRGLSQKDLARKKQDLLDLLNAVERNREDSMDEEIIWVEHMDTGIRNPVQYGYWRRFASKHQNSERLRLLGPEEVQEEQEKVAAAAARRAEKQRLFRMLPFNERDGRKWFDFDLDDLQELTSEQQLLKTDVSELRKLLESQKAEIEELKVQTTAGDD